MSVSSQLVIGLDNNTSPVNAAVLRCHCCIASLPLLHCFAVTAAMFRCPCCITLLLPLLHCSAAPAALRYCCPCCIAPLPLLHCFAATAAGLDVPHWPTQVLQERWEEVCHVAAGDDEFCTDRNTRVIINIIILCAGPWHQCVAYIHLASIVKSRGKCVAQYAQLNISCNCIHPSICYYYTMLLFTKKM